MLIKKSAGVIVTVLVALIPVILFLLGGGTTDSWAKIAALAALSLLSFNIILSARLPIFDRLFLGLDRAYRAHRIIGGTVLLLAMAHTMLIVNKYSSISLLSGYEFLKPNLDIALMMGKLALAGMMTFVVISLYINIKYQWFVMVQRLLGAMLFLVGYHALFVSGSNVRSNPLLLTYVIILGGSAAGLYIYRSLFHKTVTRKLSYEVTNVEHNQDITTIWLKPLGKALAFYGGQFAFFQFRSDAVDVESHPFSMSSSSNDQILRIAAKASGDYTNELAKLKVGDRAEVEGPFGRFTVAKQTGKNQVWVAGGIGITPFLSMAQTLPNDRTVKLYYCVRSIDQAIFLDELKTIAIKNPRFHIETVCTDQNQRITGEQMITKGVDRYLLCAPSSMMKDLEAQLVKQNVPRECITYEDFSLI